MLIHTACHFPSPCPVRIHHEALCLLFADYSDTNVKEDLGPDSCIYSLTKRRSVVENKQTGALLPGHCAGAELGVMCSSMLSVRSRFLSLSSRPWYTIPVNWFASVWLLPGPTTEKQTVSTEWAKHVHLFHLLCYQEQSKMSNCTAKAQLPVAMAVTQSLIDAG